MLYMCMHDDNKYTNLVMFWIRKALDALKTYLLIYFHAIFFEAWSMGAILVNKVEKGYATLYYFPSPTLLALVWIFFNMVQKINLLGFWFQRSDSKDYT